jgi:hypothetical protein
MDLVAVAIAVVSALIAAGGFGVARKARGDSKRSANAAADAEHRAARPRLLIEPDGDVAHDATDVIFRVHNLDGPDLVSVVVHRPVLGPADGQVVHPVAATSRTDYGDTAEIGPIPIAQYGRFTFKLGSSETLPEFRVRITCTATGKAPWELGEVLKNPRGPRPARVSRTNIINR